MALRKQKKPRVQTEVFDEICQRIAEGEGLRPMCDKSNLFPSWRTVLRFVREDEDAHARYREARQIQAEVMRDEIIELVQKPLPTDPKLAMAEVGRRRLEVDAKDKHIRQMQPSGVRDKKESGDRDNVLEVRWTEGLATGGLEVVEPGG